MNCKNCKREANAYHGFCEHCGERFIPEEEIYRLLPPPTPEHPQPYEIPPVTPMKWFRFVTGFAFYASIIVSIVNIIGAFTGVSFSNLGLDMEALYEEIEGLKALDIAYAVYMVIMLGVSIFVRTQLVNYKKNAPKYFIMMYLFEGFVTLIYSYLTYSLLGYIVEDVLPSMLGTMISFSVIVAANTVYFKKREHMFNC